MSWSPDEIYSSKRTYMEAVHGYGTHYRRSLSRPAQLRAGPRLAQPLSRKSATWPARESSTPSPSKSPSSRSRWMSA